MIELFMRDFEKHGFHPEKQVSVSPNEGEAPISIAIYVDGAAFHVGERLRRDRWIRERLRNGEPPWTVVELRAVDLNNMTAFLADLGEVK